MKSIGYMYADSAAELLARLQAEQPGSRIVSVYASGGRHYAWYEVVEAVPVPASTPPVPQVEAETKRKKSTK